MAEKRLNLTNYTKIKTIDHLSKIYRRITNGMLLAFPQFGLKKSDVLIDGENGFEVYRIK